MEIIVIIIEGKDVMLKVCVEREEGSLNNKVLFILVVCFVVLCLGICIEYCLDILDV